jgi:hypothetical protein
MESGLYRSPIKPKEESGMAVPGRLQEAQAAGPETTSRGPLSTVPGRLQEAQAAGPETTRRGPLSAVQGRIQNAPAPTLVPDPNKTRLEEEAKFVKTFAEQVYGVSYLNMMDWIDYLKTALAQDYRDQFYKDFYPDEKINEINKKKLTLSFQPSKPAEFLNQYGDMDDFEVEGVVTTKSDLNNPGELVSTQPVTLNVGVLHGSDLKLPFSVGRLASSP